MKLEASLIADGSVRMVQIQLHLANLHYNFRISRRGKKDKRTYGAQNVEWMDTPRTTIRPS